MGQRKKQSFLQGALILSLAAILTKVIGALFFKIPLQRMSTVANGYFSTAYNVYVPIYTVCTAGFPIAVSRMVSESITLGRFRDVRVKSKKDKPSKKDKKAKDSKKKKAKDED